MKRTNPALKLVRAEPAIVARPRAIGAALPLRGYAVQYRDGAHCPGCDGRHWWIGRASAECARCGTALPIATGSNAA